MGRHDETNSIFRYFGNALLNKEKDERSERRKHGENEGRKSERKETNGNRKKEQMKERKEGNRMDLRAEDIIKVSTLSLKSSIKCAVY